GAAGLGLARGGGGNRGGEPAVEFAFPAPRLRFLEACTFALAGADFSASLSGRTVPQYAAVDARPGDELRFAGMRRGQWAYLALAGGIAAGRRLGSASADLRSGIGARLRPGAALAAAGPARGGGRGLPGARAPLPGDRGAVRRVRAPAEPPSVLEGAEVVLSPVRDRAGYRTEAPAFPGGEGVLPSEGVAPGTVQIPPD